MDFKKKKTLEETFKETLLKRQFLKMDTKKVYRILLLLRVYFKFFSL